MRGQRHDDVCGAIPHGGDGSFSCDLPAMHRGIHEGDWGDGDGTRCSFIRIKRFSSARSRRNRRNARTIYIEGLDIPRGDA